MRWIFQIINDEIFRQSVSSLINNFGQNRGTLYEKTSAWLAVHHDLY